MPGIPSPPLIREDTPPTEANFRLSQYLQDLYRMARSLTFLDSDGGITSGRRCLNIEAVWVRYVSNGVADTEDTVAHNLLRTPLGVWVSVPDINAVVYRGPTAWTSTNIFLRATAATVTVDLLVF